MWQHWRINWLEVVLTGIKRHKHKYSGFTEEEKIPIQIGYLLGMLMMLKDISGIDMVLSMESKRSSDKSTRYFNGIVENARYLLVDGSIFTSKSIFSAHFAVVRSKSLWGSNDKLLQVIRLQSTMPK